jgi:anti-sigma factor RsiW
MNCREVVDFLMDYLADELAPAERERFEEHLAECTECVRFLRSYQATLRLTKAAFRDPHAPPPEEIPEALVNAILFARRASL